MIDQISTYDAAKWMARLTATDGAISPAERKVLSEFADAFSIDRTKLVRLAYGMTNEVAVPEVEIVNQKEKNGRLFEEFVVSLLADKSIFKLLAWRSDKIVGDTYATENLYPDLHIFHKLDVAEVEYFVECKYRISWGEDGIDLSEQFNRYHFHAKARGVELFIALGVGGTPSAPEEFFIIPSRMVKLDTKIDRTRFIKCLCSQSPEALHNYIEHYYTPIRDKIAISCM